MAQEERLRVLEYCLFNLIRLGEEYASLLKMHGLLGSYCKVGCPEGETSKIWPRCKNGALSMRTKNGLVICEVLWSSSFNGVLQCTLTLSQLTMATCMVALNRLKCQLDSRTSEVFNFHRLPATGRSGIYNTSISCPCNFSVSLFPKKTNALFFKDYFPSTFCLDAIVISHVQYEGSF